MRTRLTTLAVALVASSIFAAPSAHARAPRVGCGRALTGHYTLYRRGSDCRTARHVLEDFSRQTQRGTRHLVPGGRHMVDSQLPFAVDGWRCGGLEGQIVCVQGTWRTVNPPRTGHSSLDAVLRAAKIRTLGQYARAPRATRRGFAYSFLTQHYRDPCHHGRHLTPREARNILAAVVDLRPGYDPADGSHLRPSLGIGRAIAHLLANIGC